MNDLTKPDSGSPDAGAPVSTVDTAYEAAKRAILIAYILWFFLGSLGAHRFYLGRTGSAIAMVILTAVSTVLSVVFIGAFGFFVLGVWLFVDIFLIPGMTASYNEDLRRRLETGPAA